MNEPKPITNDVDDEYPRARSQSWSSTRWGGTVKENEWHNTTPTRVDVKTPASQNTGHNKNTRTVTFFSGLRPSGLDFSVIRMHLSRWTNHTYEATVSRQKFQPAAERLRWLRVGHICFKAGVSTSSDANLDWCAFWKQLSWKHNSKVLDGARVCSVLVT